MKQLFISLAAGLFCLLATSCGGPTNQIKSIADKIESNGNDWTDEDQWHDTAVEFFEACCDFAETDFDEDQLEEFVDACIAVAEAIDNIDDSKAEKAFKKAMKAIDKEEELGERVEKCAKKAMKRVKKLDAEDAINEAIKYVQKFNF